MIFLKNDPTPCATLKQVFLDRFELVVAHFGPPKIPKCLENGLFWDQNGSKMSQKRIFPKLILDHLGCTNVRHEPILSLFGGIFSPQKSKKALKVGFVVAFNV